MPAQSGPQPALQLHHPPWVLAASPSLVSLTVLLTLAQARPLCLGRSLLPPGPLCLAPSLTSFRSLLTADFPAEPYLTTRSLSSLRWPLYVIFYFRAAI